VAAAAQAEAEPARAANPTTNAPAVSPRLGRGFARGKRALPKNRANGRLVLSDPPAKPGADGGASIKHYPDKINSWCLGALGGLGDYIPRRQSIPNAARPSREIERQANKTSN